MYFLRILYTTHRKKSRIVKKNIPESKYAPIYDYNEEEELQRREERRAAKASSQKWFGITFKRRNDGPKNKKNVDPDEDASLKNEDAEEAAEIEAVAEL